MSDLSHQYIADRINSRNKEDIPHLFWLAVLLFSLLLCSNVMAADAKLMIDIIECESSGRHNAVGDDGVSYGIAQFRKDTFTEFASQSKIKGLHYRNPIHQLKLMNWALDNGYGYRWTCYRKLHPVMDSVSVTK